MCTFFNFESEETFWQPRVTIEDTIRYFNIRFTYENINGYVVTIASALMDNKGDKTYPKSYVAGHAYCSPKDKFKKSVGREIAVERLVENLYKNYVFNLFDFEVNYRFLKSFIFNAYCAIDYVQGRLPYSMLDKYDIEVGVTFLDLMTHRINNKIR